MKFGKDKKKKLWIVLAVLVALVAATVGILFACGVLKGDVPTITGVQEQLIVYEDDSEETVEQILLDGVSTTGDTPYAVLVEIRSKTDDFAVTDLTPGTYTVRYYCDRRRVEPVFATLTVKPADTEAPVISGASDKEVRLNDTVSYRDGVTVTDNADETVELLVDASKVDLTKAGTYAVTYSATDSRGNTATVTVHITVKKASASANSGETPNAEPPANKKSTKEKLDALCTKILGEILKNGMSDRQKAEAIYNRVNRMKYVNTPDNGDWVENAYVGLNTGRGDCENYSSASRALLEAAGIQCYELERVGGTSEHYWQIVYVDGGWYHFDPCPKPAQYPLRCFLLTDEEVIAYSNSRTDKPNYYIYNHDACPHKVVQSR